jgi:hypothetical protein
VDEAHALLREQEDRLRRVADSPVVRFARQQFRAIVDGVACDVESDLAELFEPAGGAGGRHPRLSAAVRVTGESSARRCTVELDETG